MSLIRTFARKPALFVVLSLAVLLTVVSATGQERPLRVLFVGNSYTYVNNLPGVLKELAESKGKKLETGLASFGGATLQAHLQDDQTPGKIRSRKWDYVVLQEQSLLGSVLMVNGRSRVGDPENFHTHARLIDEEIKKAGAKTMFFLTWGRKGSDFEIQQKALTYAYMTIAEELKAEVAPVGLAWRRVDQAEAGLNLYQSDGSHPNPFGTYAAACVFYAALFDESPVGVTDDIEVSAVKPDGSPRSDRPAVTVRLKASEAETIQRAAWESHQRLKSAGGYLRASKPQAPSLPQLPAGKPFRTADLEGVWQGHLMLYRFTATMRLQLVHTPDGWGAKAQISFGPTNLTPEADDLRITDEGLYFTDRKGLPEGLQGAQASYRGVYTGEEIAGVAEVKAEGHSVYLIGTFNLKKMR